MNDIAPHRSLPSTRNNWLHRPQSVGIRRALFQIHLWVGIGGGLYVLLTSLTGSASLLYITLFGADETSNWLARLHGDLLLGRRGLVPNTIGGVLLAVIGVTGAIIWWPGLKSWRRSLKVPRGSGRFNWHLHSATGFWTLAFVLMFALTGVLLSLPIRVFRMAVSVVGILGVDPDKVYDLVRPGIRMLHEGPSSHPVVRLLWAVLGLAPVLLLVTGFLMWWRRVVRPAR